MAILAATVIPARPVDADTSSPEYQAKAVFVYKVAKFIHWPSDAFVSSSAPLVLCIAGIDPFGRYIDDLNGEIIRGRPLIMRRAGNDQHELRRCPIVFVGDEPGRLSVFASVADDPVLTIGDTTGFAASGGMLGLGISHNRTDFEVNLDVAREARPDISASLLQLATIVTSRVDQ